MSINLSEKTAALSLLKSRFDLTSEIQSQVIEITPDMAEKLLFLSDGNRVLKPAFIAYLINNIKNGTFLTTNNAIGFDTDLVLRDGHHRLNAIKSAGVPVKCLVTVNIPKENFRYVDNGVNRTMSDKVQLFTTHEFDFKITAKVTGTANALIGCCTPATWHISTKDSVFLEKIIYDNRIGFELINDHCHRSDRLLSVSAIKAAFAAAANHVNNSKLIEFCNQFYGGENARIAGASNAPYILRDYILTGKLDAFLKSKNASTKGGLGSTQTFEMFYMTQFCISKYIAGEDLTTRRIQSGYEKNSEGKLQRKPVIYQPVIDFNAYRNKG